MSNRNGGAGFQVYSPSPPGVWGADRVSPEHYPVDGAGEMWGAPMDDRDLVAPCRDSRGAWLLDGAQWQALRASECGPEMETATYADKAPEVPNRRPLPVRGLGKNARARLTLVELRRQQAQLRASRPW